MPNVTAIPVGQSDGSIVREFTDVVGTVETTYYYPVQQGNLIVWNKGDVNLYLTVGNYTNVAILPKTTWNNNVFFTSFRINTIASSSDFLATAREDASTVNDIGYDIIIVAGQSNSVGYANSSSGGNGPSTTLDYSDTRILQYAMAGTNQGKLVVATEPLAHPDTSNQSPLRLGSALVFAKWYLHAVSPNRRVVLLPCAYGSTGFDNGTGRWVAGVGGDLLNSAVNTANTLIKDNPNTRLAAILWVQGEKDSGMTKANYITQLDNMIAFIRGKVYGSSNVPFIIGSMVPEWVTAQSGLQNNIQPAHQETPSRVPKTIFVLGPSEMTNHATSDYQHYNELGQRELGKRLFFNGYVNVVNAPAGAAPNAPTNLTVSAKTNVTVDLSWAASSSGVLDYKVEYKKSSDTDWIDFNHVMQTDTTIKVVKLLANTSYDFRVAAINTTGLSPYSNIVTTTTNTTNTVTVPSRNFHLKSTAGITKDGSNIITAVTDQSPNARGITIVGSPTAVADGSNQVITCTAAQYFSVSGGFPANNNYTKMILINFTDLTGYGNLISSSDGGNHVWWRNNGGTNLQSGHGGTWTYVRSQPTLVANKWYLLTLTWDKTTGAYRMYYDKTLVGTGINTTTTSGVATCQINTYNSLGNGSNCKILEAMTWNTPLTHDQIIKEADRVITDYGITLDW